MTAQAGPVGLSGGLIQIQPRTTSQISSKSMSFSFC